MDDGLVEITPNQFSQPFFAVLEPEFRQFSDAYGAKTQVHADARGPALGRQVTGVGVVLQHVDVDLGFRRFDGTPLEPHVLKAWQIAAIPSGQGVQVIFGRGRFEICIDQVGVPAFAVRGENGVGKAVGFGHFAGRFDHVVFVGVERHASGLKHLPNLRIALQSIGFVILIRVDFNHVKLVAQRGEHIHGMPVFDPQATAVLPGLLVQVGHAVVQERHPGVVLRIENIQDGAVKHKHRQHRVPRIQGRVQGSVVVPTQVATKPVKDDFSLGK